MKRITCALIFSVLCLAVLAAPKQMAVTTAMAATNPTAAGATVSISNFQFTPQVLSVKAGTTVTCVVKEGTHTVTADNGAFASDNLSAGQNFTFTFTTPGTYRYYCSFHGGKGGVNMSGMIRVTR